MRSLSSQDSNNENHPFCTCYKAILELAYSEETFVHLKSPDVAVEEKKGEFL